MTASKTYVDSEVKMKRWPLMQPRLVRPDTICLFIYLILQKSASNFYVDWDLGTVPSHRGCFCWDTLCYHFESSNPPNWSPNVQRKESRRIESAPLRTGDMSPRQVHRQSDALISNQIADILQNLLALNKFRFRRTRRTKSLPYSCILRRWGIDSFFIKLIDPLEIISLLQKLWSRCNGNWSLT